MRRLLAERERRGLTYQEIAEEAGVGQHALLWWESRFKDGADPVQEFVELLPEPSTATGSLELELELPCGRHLRVPVDFDEEHLRRLLVVLASC